MNGALLALARQVVTRHQSSFGEFSLREEFPGSSHKDTQSIYLRAPPWPIKEAATSQDDLRVVDWPTLQLDDQLRGVLLTLQEVVKMPMARAMIVKLSPGGAIGLHMDEGVYSQATERFHFPVFTNLKAISRIGDEEVNMTAGVLWWYQKDELHSARNEGEDDRVHIIFDTWRS